MKDDFSFHSFTPPHAQRILTDGVASDRATNRMPRIIYMPAECAEYCEFITIHAAIIDHLAQLGDDADPGEYVPINMYCIIDDRPPTQADINEHGDHPARFMAMDAANVDDDAQPHEWLKFVVQMLVRLRTDDPFFDIMPSQTTATQPSKIPS